MSVSRSELYSFLPSTLMPPLLSEFITTADTEDVEEPKKAKRVSKPRIESYTSQASTTPVFPSVAKASTTHNAPYLWALPSQLTPCYASQLWHAQILHRRLNLA